MVHGWQLEEDAARLFPDAMRSNVFDILAIIDGIPTLIAVCKSPPRTLSARFYVSDWVNMKKWCEIHGWKRLLLVHYNDQWYKVEDQDWLDKKVSSSKTKSQVAIGLAKKAILIN